MKAYLSSGSGRLLAITAAFAFGVAGLVPILHLPYAVLAITYVVTVGLVVATEFAAINPHPTAAVVLAITLPQSIYGYVVLSLVAANKVPQLGWLLILLACLALAELVAVTTVIPVMRHRPRHA
jgi:hypothetical protein